jgi:hypothetical protein
MDDEEFCVPGTRPGRGKCREVPNGAYEIKITIPERIGNIYSLHNGRPRSREKTKAASARVFNVEEYTVCISKRLYLQVSR